MQPVAARVVAETLADAASELEIENGRITEVAGPKEERLAEAAAALFARVRTVRGGRLRARIQLVRLARDRPGHDRGPDEHRAGGGPHAPLSDVRALSTVTGGAFISSERQ